MNPNRSEHDSTRLGTPFLLGVFCLWSISASFAQELRIGTPRLGTDGKLRIEYQANLQAYYILYRGDSVTTIAAPADMALGVLGTGVLADPISPANTRAVFYRLKQVPISQPLDTDGDSIDDVYELQHGNFLDPLDPLDAFQDPDRDGLTNLQEFQRGSDPAASEFVAPAVQAIASPTSAGSVTVNGTAKPNTTVKIDGGASSVTTTAGANAAFSVAVPLQANRLNRLFVSTSDTNGQTSALQPLEVVQDSQAPALFIDFPADNSVLTTTNTVIAGRVGDMLSGFLGLDVTVTNLTLGGTLSPPANVPSAGGSANVIVGIGNNGTYERGAVPLAFGQNIIQVTATDRVGNSTNKQITLTRAELSGPKLITVSGDAQLSNVHRRLTEPIVVRLTQADGITPIANTRVTFDVIRSDGRLLPVDATQLAADYTTRPDVNANGALQLQLNTDTAGQAQVWWTLGGDAGCANNRVRVASASVSNQVFFCASAKPALPRQINIGSGNTQKTEAGGPAPEPLRAWVNDSCNGVEGIPVTFSVVQGRGKLLLNEQSAIPPSGTNILTILTALTGHASVNFQLGPDPGQNIIEANFPGNPGLPAMFVLYGVTRDLTKPTTLTGLVLDNSSQPIGNALCEIFVPPDLSNPVLLTHTDTQGRFAFTNTPAGSVHLFVFGASATSVGTNAIPPNSFPFLTYPMTLIPNAENSLPNSILLPHLNPRNTVLYNGTTNLVLTCEGVDGLKMTIKANSMRDVRGLLVTPQNPAQVSLNQVHHDKIPMPIPDGASPPFAWTLQPARATFDPPIQIEYPNMSGLPAGTIAYFLSFNHDTERFEIVASGHVTDDGAQIVTDPNAGLAISGWGCNCPPYSVVGDCEDPCGDDDGAKLAQRNGAKPAIDETCTLSCDNPFQRKDPVLGLCGPYTCGLTEDEFFAFIGPAQYPLKAQAAVVVFTTREFLGMDLYGPVGSEEAARLVNAHRHIWWQCVVTKNFGVSMAEAWASAHEFGRYADIGYTPGSAIGCGSPVENAPCDEDHLLDLWNNAIGRSLGLDPNVNDCMNAALDAALGKLPGIEPGIHLTHELYERINNELPIPGCIPTGEGIVPQSSPQGSPPAAVCPTLSVEPGQIVLKVGETAQFSVKVTDCAGTITDLTQDASKTVYFIWDGVIQTSAKGQITAVTPGDATLNVLCRPDATGPVLTKDIPVRVVDASGNPVLPVGRGAYITNVWQVSVNGQVGTMTGRHGFLVANVSAPDAFGDAGPGSSPDFVSDDYVRAVAVSSVAGDTLYAYSDFFKVRQGQRVSIKNLTYTRVPPRQPESLEILPEARVMTALGQSNRLQVVAGYADGTTGNVTGQGLWTSYRASNPAIASVDANGVVTARNAGTVFVTAVNEGVSAVTAITVAPGDQPTTLVGQAVDAGGLAVAGAEVILRTGDLDRRAVTGPDGSFTFSQVPSSLGPLVVTVLQQVPVGRRVGVAKGFAVVAGGETRLAKLIVQPLALRMRSDFAAGSGHTAALQSDRSLWAWGNSPFGQVGNGGLVVIEVPVPIGTDRTWQELACGWSHTLAVKSDGSLWTWGLNTSGQLGNGNFRNVSAPVAIGSDLNWKIVNGGATHTVAVKTDGTLWAWGGNQRGQLGVDIGTSNRRNTPTQVGTESNWQEVAGGESHTVALKVDGSLWAWGANDNGQLGDGTDSDRNQPVRIGTENDWRIVGCGAQHTVALKANGSLWAWGLNFEGQSGNGATLKTNTPTRIGTDDDWVALACGGAHSAAVKADGSLWAWGQNAYGQLGNSSDQRTVTPVRAGSENDWLAVACGGSHTIALKTDASLWAWGVGLSGQLGNRPVASVDLPNAIGNDIDWRGISAGELHTLALKTDGSLWALGYNVNGQLGLGNRLINASPSRVGLATDWASVTAGAVSGRHSLALKANGSLWAWGWNLNGQLGLGDNVDTDNPAQIGSDLDWMSVTSGHRHTVSLKQDGSLWAWGANLSGQLGDASSNNDANRPVRIGTERNWRAAACGELHTVALKADGSLWAWGYNLDGRLGIGTSFNVNAPNRIGTDQDWQSVVSGPRHTVALKTGGSLWAWGNNNHGQLGDGTVQRADAPRRVGSETDWLAAACGDGHTVALKQDGSLWGWGFNFDGQLGTGTRVDSRVPVRIATGTQWKAVACGANFTVALRADGTLLGWGSNDRGQIGQPVSWLPRPVTGVPNWGLGTQAFPIGGGSILPVGQALNSTVP